MAFTLKLGAQAPDFKLKATDGNLYGLNDFSQYPCLVIFFSCNHCPYVKNSNEITRNSCLKFEKHGAKFIAINSNSKDTYSEDSFDNMIKVMSNHNYPWLYLLDDSQEVALKYGALRTPHFFVFDQKRHLIYTGRGIDSPKNPSAMTVNNLDIALEEYFSNKPISVPLTNPIGCNVKWKGQDKHWMPPEACDLIP
jgi:peroxiredoxin